MRAPKPFLAMTEALAKKRLAFSHGESLTRLPRGFEAVDEPAVAAAIRRKSYICSRPLDDAAIGKRALIDAIVAFAHDAMPLLEWGWAAIVDER